MDPKRSLRQEGRPRSAALLAPLLLIALCLAIAGCGGGGDSSPQDKASTQGKSSQAEPRSAEASIEGFGKEAEGAERQAILAAFTGYLEAIAHKDYESACSQMAAQLQESLSQLTGKKGAACAKLLPLLVSPEAAAVARGQLEGTVRKVRVEGERGFVVFKAPGAKLYDMAMSEEGGEWRVASSAAGVLVPEL